MSKWDKGRHIRFTEKYILPIKIEQFVHASEVMTGTLIGVNTIKPYGNKDIGNFRYFT